MANDTTKPTGPDGQYTPAERRTFAAIRAALRADGQPRRETPDIAAAAQLAPLLASAAKHLAQTRQIAHGIAPLPQGGD